MNLSKEEIELIQYGMDCLFWFGIVYVIGRTIGLGWVGSGLKNWKI